MQPFTEQVPGPYEDTTCQMVMAYGDPDHAHLNTIRRFRDTVLSRMPGGAALIALYYRMTPYIAGAMAGQPTLKAAMRYGCVYPVYLLSRLLTR